MCIRIGSGVFRYGICRNLVFIGMSRSSAPGLSRSFSRRSAGIHMSDGKRAQQSNSGSLVVVEHLLVLSHSPDSYTHGTSSRMCCRLEPLNKLSPAVRSLGVHARFPGRGVVRLVLVYTPARLSSPLSLAQGQSWRVTQPSRV